MKAVYKQYLTKAKSQKKELDEKLKRIKKANNQKAIDQRLVDLIDEAFGKIDCLSCANCCATTSPIFTKQDISRISQLFNVKEKEYIAEVLEEDENGVYGLQCSPCQYLQNDQKCFIYDKRPKACKGFPHIGEYPIKQILKETKRNISICPAVAYVFLKFEI